MNECATVAAVLEAHAAHGGHMKPIDLSACWNRIGKLSSNRTEELWLRQNLKALGPLLRRTKRDAGRLPPRPLANTAHGIAKVVAAIAWTPGDYIWKLFEQRGLRLVHEFKPQELANMAWAFATAGVAAPTLFTAVAEGAVPRMHEFKPQELSNMAWAFAKADHAATALFDSVDKAAAPLLHEFKPQELANTAWAFAAAGHAAPAFFDGVGKAAAPRLHAFKPQEFLNMVWAFAKVGHSAPLLFDAAAKAAAPRLDEFKPQDFANTAWAFATAGHAAPALFDSVAKAAAPRLHEFKPQELANTAWAFASAGHAAPVLFDGVGKAAALRLHEFKPQLFANTAWAFSVIDLPSESLFGSSSPFYELVKIHADAFSGIERCQLHQWQLWRQEHGSDNALPVDLRKRCLEAFITQNEIKPSTLQKEVITALSMLDEVTEVQEEVKTATGYSLDALVTFRSQKVGIEVDGPSHFVLRSRMLTGSTSLKRRQLEALEGTRLLSVPYWDWAGASKNERSIYLQRELSRTLEAANTIG
jgi:hypothetical protein